jgi:hypothetical protein
MSAGTLVTNAPAGNCHKDVCDAAGNIITVVDDTDKPVDGNACTSDVCTSGVPSNPPVASGTSCGGTLVCDGNGACVGCLQATDCPGTDTACQHRTCAGGSCGTANTAVGTLVTNAPAGDCHKDVCDGNGAVVTVVDVNDLPSTANPCLGNACGSDGTPSNPPLPSGTACSQGNGIKCDGAGTCVACLAVSDCSGSDTTCQHRTCVNGSCGVSNSPFGTLVTVAPAGDCHRDVCDGSGGVQPVVDDNDLPASTNQCVQNVCTGGVPSNPPQAAGVACNQGGLLCDGNGTCVGCLVASTCPGGIDTTCQTKTCIGGTCGLAFADDGTLVTVEPAGDCQNVVCDGSGGTKNVPNIADLPTSSNQCLQNVCTGSVPSNPPQPATTACNQTNNNVLGSECDGNGACVQCLTAADCPGGPDTECNTRTCTNGVCGLTQPDLNTPLATQTPGDCLTAVCDGTGGFTTLADDNDAPANTNQCATVTCIGGAPSTTNSAPHTSCTQNNGRTCDGQGSCLLTFSVVRIGDGTTTLSSAAFPVFIDERKLDGTVVGTVSLPTAVSGTGNTALTNSGSANSEGGMSLSGDGRYLVLAGYNAAPTTAAIASTLSSATNRVVGRVGANGAVDTTTRINAAFSANNVRGATSQDGTGFWVGGNGSASGLGGTWFVLLGSTGAATQLLTAPVLTNTRWPTVQGGQLYSSASSGATFNNVHTVGTGLPTSGTAPPVALTVLPGMPANLNPFGYVFFDRDGTPGFDTLYVADDGGASTRGIQKWTLAAGTWTRTATFNLTPTAQFEGLAGYVTGSDVTLIASTDETLPRLVVFVDTGTGTPTGTVISTSATNTVFRGVALAPHL